MAGNTDSEFKLLSIGVVLALGSFVTFSKSLNLVPKLQGNSD